MVTVSGRRWQDGLRKVEKWGHIEDVETVGSVLGGVYAAPASASHAVWAKGMYCADSEIMFNVTWEEGDSRYRWVQPCPLGSFFI